jgi:hypothetical protein
LSTQTVQEFLIEGEVADVRTQFGTVLLSIGSRWFFVADARVGECVARGSSVRLLVRAAIEPKMGEVLILQSELLPPTYVGSASGVRYLVCGTSVFAVGLYLLSQPILISSAVLIGACVWLTHRRQEAFRLFAMLCTERLASLSAQERKSELADDPSRPRGEPANPRAHK